jgi:hypothetical protein
VSDIRNCWLVCRDGLGAVGEGDGPFAMEMFEKFLHSLEKPDLAGEALCFYTDGVKLVADDSPVVESLRLLEKLGMRIVICGSCVDHFGMRERVAVGEIGGMTEIVALLRAAGRVVRV